MRRPVKNRVAFIDASNLVHGATKEGWKIDFQKLCDYLRRRHGCISLKYFGGVDTENNKQLKFYKKLEIIGYELYLVEVKKFKDGKKKANCDARMTFEIMRDLSKCENCILITGDGDFFWVFEYMIKNNKKPKLFGFNRSTAKELKTLFKSNYTDINSIREIIYLEQTKMRRTPKGIRR